jgi:hypothetical protein
MVNSHLKLVKLQRLLEDVFGLQDLNPEHPMEDALGRDMRVFWRALDSVVPGICMNEGCNRIQDCEPDAATNLCEKCDTLSVASLTVLGGIIAECDDENDGA